MTTIKTPVEIIKPFRAKISEFVLTESCAIKCIEAYHNQFEPKEHECKYCQAMTTQDDEQCYANPDLKQFTKQDMVNFCQHLLKDYSTIEVTQETLNNFLNKK